MGSYKKSEQLQEVQETKAQTAKPKELNVAASQIDIVLVEDKEKKKRHDMQDKKDHDLAAMLQANWANVVAAEHRTNH